MTTHHSPVDIRPEQPPLPNQHFSSWLRSQTTLFISQIVATLTFVLFVAEEVYYISHAGEKGELLQTITVRLIVDIAHIVFMTIFALVLIRFLDDNDRGSYRVKLVYKRVFKEPNPNEPGVEERAANESDAKDKEHKSALDASKDQLRKFKYMFLCFWIGMLFLYVCFACQHGYKLATSKPKGESTYESHLVVSTGGQGTSFKSETNYHTADLSDAQNSFAETKDSKIEPLKDWWDIIKHLAFPFFVFLLNNLTMYFIFLCFLIAYIPATEMKNKYSKYRNYALVAFFVLTGAFLLFAVLVALVKEFTASEWDAYSAMFDGVSGVLNAIVFALLIARLDSKLVGLPSWLISILYSYAAAQPLFIVFELNQTDVFEKITTAVLIFVFVAKIYFFLIITYALQTGKMLNYLFCFPILHKRAKKTQRVKKGDPVEMEPRSEDLESDEGWLMRVIHSRSNRWLGTQLGQMIHVLIHRLRLYLSEKLRSESYFKASRPIGLVAVILFPICLIFILLIQPAPPLFSVNDLRNADSLALKLRAPGRVSEYLIKKLSCEAMLKWKQYNSTGLSSTVPKEVVVEALNAGITDPKLFEKERFEGVKFSDATIELQKNNPQGNALIGLNRLLLEDTYPELFRHGENRARTFADVVSDFLFTYVKIGSDLLHLVLILIICLILYLVRTDNRYGGRRTIKTPARVFKDNLKSDYTVAAGKRQLTKFKEYFFYFWLAMALLYLVLLLQHLGLQFGPATENSILAMIKILLYPFLGFLFSSLNLLFIFWCFVILRSPAFNERAKTRQKVLINYSTFVVALLIAAFPLLVFVVGGPKLSESDLRGYATIFNGVAGVLSAVGWALLIARMDSKLFGLPMWSMGILFAYASIQPLFVVFALNDAVLRMLQTSVLLTAFLLKICFFLIISHSLQSGKVLNYLICFPFLKERVDSIFENQFEIRLALTRHEDKFTFSILKKNQLYYSTMIKFDSRRECDSFVHYLRARMENRGAYSDPPHEESGAHWVEVKTADPERLICESIPLRSEKECLDLIEESMEKIPYCKYDRA